MGLARKDLKMLRDLVKPYGHQIVQTRDHYKILTKDGRRIGTLSCSPSDRNAIRHVIADLRRYNHIA